MRAARHGCGEFFCWEAWGSFEEGGFSSCVVREKKAAFFLFLSFVDKNAPPGFFVFCPHAFFFLPLQSKLPKQSSAPAASWRRSRQPQTLAKKVTFFFFLFLFYTGSSSSKKKHLLFLSLSPSPSLLSHLPLPPFSFSTSPPPPPPTTPHQNADPPPDLFPFPPISISLASLTFVAR